MLCFNNSPLVFPLDQRRTCRSIKVKAPVASVSEEVRKKVVENPRKLKVRAAVTVRRKNKEDFKEALVKQLDALTDKIGRNVVLELISTEVNPSNTFFLFKFVSFCMLCFS